MKTMFAHVMQDNKVFGRMLFDRLLPHHCPSCQSFVEGRGLCPACWKDLEMITAPYCIACGRPMPHEQFDQLCIPCYKRPFLATPIRAALRYNDAAKQLILPFKHADRLDYVTVIARILLPLFLMLLDEADFIMPVPLHRRRYFARGYNQAAELARTLCMMAEMHHKFAPNLLLRTRWTPSMGRLNAYQRRQNIANAFGLSDKAGQLKGANIMLIDDVMTTGATLNGCARVLLQKAGCQQVAALVFARVFS